MGVIRKILAKKIFSAQAFFYNQLRIESAEAIHFHWRDIRLLATPKQFVELICGMSEANDNWNGGASNDEDVALSITTIPDGIIFYNEGVIEEQENGCIHFHYQDARIEMTPERFLMMARLFEQAKREYNKERLVIIPMDRIDPYDPGHLADEDSWKVHDREDYDNHMDGISKVVNGILAGRKIRPISVKKNGDYYKRFDGFKRYMAYKRLNYENMPCYIMGEDVAPGCQDGQSWFLEDE